MIVADEGTGKKTLIAKWIEHHNKQCENVHCNKKEIP